MPLTPTMPDFKEFPKVPRLNRTVIVTEKIDGTNACVIVSEDGTVSAQSRTRIITPEDDNFGFAAWVRDHAEELRGLGVGYHFGEWWGRGIQRGYGMKERFFSLFDTRWGTGAPGTSTSPAPACCRVVPVLSIRNSFEAVDIAMLRLRDMGSIAAPGFMDPEGVMAFHTASRSYFKATLKNDESPKSTNPAG